MEGSEVVGGREVGREGGREGGPEEAVAAWGAADAKTATASSSSKDRKSTDVAIKTRRCYAATGRGERSQEEKSGGQRRGRSRSHLRRTAAAGLQRLVAAFILFTLPFRQPPSGLSFYGTQSERRWEK
jgi:hypothetical protein